MENSFEITRKHEGRTLRLSARYSEVTDDWNVALFEGRSHLDARTTTNVYAEARDMFELALASGPPLIPNAT